MTGSPPDEKKAMSIAGIMKRTTSMRFSSLILISLCVPSIFAQPDPKAIPYGNNIQAGNVISIRGAKQYYEIYGKGEPLVLIHGNGGNIAYMKPQIEYFAKKYKVVVMDCRGRGQSELGDEGLTYMQMTKDIIGILDHLHIDSAYVVGRSDGGIIALLMAMYYPQKVKKAVAFAANLTADTTALYPSFYSEVKRERKHAEEMLVKHDLSQNWKVIQQRNLLMEFQPNITAGDLHKITCPVLVMSTDRDIIRQEHTLYIYQNIAKANLCILTCEDHYVTNNNPELFNSTVARYLTQP
jgi:pimeloyl-ACP methyl ester carboxylesterase